MVSFDFYFLCLLIISFSRLERAMYNQTREMAEELNRMLKKKLGAATYLPLFQELSQKAAKKREDRKKKQNMTLVLDPQVWRGKREKKKKSKERERKTYPYFAVGCQAKDQKKCQKEREKKEEGGRASTNAPSNQSSKNFDGLKKGIKEKGG